jgi:hypothetical protein
VITVTAPRNPRAVARSLRERAEIRRVWLELVQAEPFERHDAAAIARRLPFKLSASGIRWHMRHIRTEALLAEPSMLAPREFIS